MELNPGDEGCINLRLYSNQFDDARYLNSLLDERKDSRMYSDELMYLVMNRSRVQRLLIHRAFDQLYSEGNVHLVVLCI